jgi:hypothetical protein
VVDLRRMRWEEHVACMGGKIITYIILIGKQEGKSYSVDIVVDGKIILELILGKQGEKEWAGLICLRIGTSGGIL